MNNKPLYKFITGKSKKPIAKIYAEKNGIQFTYYVFSKQSLKKSYQRSSTISIREY